MRTVENPKKLFRQIDATNLDEDSYTLHVDKEVTDSVKIASDEDKESFVSLTVEFEQYDSIDAEKEAALKEIRDAATRVNDADDVPDGADTQFVTEEDGERVTYMCDTSRMGYEVVRERDPLRVGYVCIFPDRIVKIHLEEN